MEKKYLPSLIIFAKGFMITCLGIGFRYLNNPSANVLLYLGCGMIVVALLVLVVMYMIKPKES